MSLATVENTESAVAVYCGSSIGKNDAFRWAAISVGQALAAAQRPLVYGGGSSGIMGVVSSTVLEAGGKVTGVIPSTILKAGGEGDKKSLLNGHAKDVETIAVDSMHERKIEMAKRVNGFIGLPGGYGTFEEVMEVTTWTQLGIHDKPVVLVNVLSFWDPLRTMIKKSIEGGFIRPCSEKLVIFVDGPDDPQEHDAFDWGRAALAEIDAWEKGKSNPLFDWSKKDSVAQDVVYQST